LVLAILVLFKSSIGIGIGNTFCQSIVIGVGNFSQVLLTSLKVIHVQNV